MNKAILEVSKIGGDSLLKLVRQEFANDDFSIIARTQEYIVLGNNTKNVSFCREKNRVLERYVFDKQTKLERKR